MTEAIDAVLLEARRPVLLSARAVAPGFAQDIAIGWNASVPSAQAVLAALPLLKRARRVEILSVEEDGGPCAQCGEVVEYLSLHGIAAASREIAAGTRPVADVLLESAAQSGAGASGARRLRPQPLARAFRRRHHPPRHRPCRIAAFPGPLGLG